MRPPKDLNDLPKLSKCIDGKIAVWCVECERWSGVIVVATATVTYRQNRWTNRIEGATDLHYHCGTHNCKADIEYLLSANQKSKILDLAEVARLANSPIK